MSLNFIQLLEEGIIDQSKIDLFIERANTIIDELCQGKKQGFTEEYFRSSTFPDHLLRIISMYLCDLGKEIFGFNIDFDLKPNQTFPVDIIENQPIKYFATGGSVRMFKTHPEIFQVTIQFKLYINDEKDYEKMITLSDDFLVANIKQSVLDNWNILTKPYFNSVLRHELTHVLQIFKNKNRYNKLINRIDDYKKQEREYFYNEMEIGAYTSQYAKLLFDKQIPIEDLKNKRLLYGFFKNRINANPAMIKYYLDENTPESKKFWKYVYLYYQKFLNKESITESLNKDIYLYHGTNLNRAISIQRDGLKTGQAIGDTINRPIYFSNTEEYAQTYASRKEFGNGIILRVKKSDVIQEDPNTGFKGDYKTSQNIPPEEIEVKTTNGQYVPIQNYDFIDQKIIK